MSFLSDMKVLYHLAASPFRRSGNTHQERLENFYSGQADNYDSFRRKLLKGREEMYRSIPRRHARLWLDMGGGTGSNLEFLGEGIHDIQKVYVVDLSTSLLGVARERCKARGWTHVEAVEADVTTFMPPEGQADIVTFSYSLTMIPDWFAAIEHAHRLLRPGGTIGVVDFYVSRKHTSGNRRRHGWFTRTFWPAWFAMDNVFPNPDHLPFLSHHFEPIRVREKVGAVPYMPGSQMPYYQFIGKKRA